MTDLILEWDLDKKSDLNSENLCPFEKYRQRIITVFNMTNKEFYDIEFMEDALKERESVNIFAWNLMLNVDFSDEDTFYISVLFGDPSKWWSQSILNFEKEYDNNNAKNFIYNTAVFFSQNKIAVENGSKSEILEVVGSYSNLLENGKVFERHSFFH